MLRTAAPAALGRRLLVLALALGAQHGACQRFQYVEPGVARCPADPGPSTAAPQVVARGVAVPGSIAVACGFGEGSYTVSLSASDPGAAFSPKTFLVNFGRLVGSGSFTVTFATLGVQRVSATITSNMGSPAVRGRFVSPADSFQVVAP